jgi:spore germination protein GerM
MNFSQKLGIFCLIVITIVYVYFSFFSENSFNIGKNDNPPQEEIISEEQKQEDEENLNQESKIVKVFVTDSKGNLRSVNRKCKVSEEKSCFEFAIKELISAPTKWEKSKGLSSEIPSGTKILSIREGSNNILIDLSSTFESGGGAESTYIRVHQLIKTANANTKLPVYLYINGKQADVIGGEGIMIKQPLSEGSLDD